MVRVSEAFENLQCLFRFRSLRVIGVERGIDHGSVAVDDNAAWKRQFPVIITIKPFQINSEIHVDLLERGREFENHAKLLGQQIVGVEQKGKTQPQVLDQVARIFLLHW